MKKIMLLLAASVLVYTTDVTACPRHKTMKHRTARVSKRTSSAFTGYRSSIKTNSSRLMNNSRLNNNLNNRSLYNDFDSISDGTMNNGKKY